MTGDARALVLKAPRTLTSRTFPLPEVRDDDALLRVEACGLCGTDHEQYTGALPSARAVPGHETVGVLDAVGSGASQRWGVSVGDRIAVEPFRACGECDRCREGVYRRCERYGLAHAYGFTPASTPPGLWGGYATHQYLGADSLVLRVPDGIDPVIATVFNPLGAGIRWAVTVPGTKPGDVVAVLGPGIRGICAAAVAKDAGAAYVLVTGLGERDAVRLETARRFGADVVVDVAQEDPVSVLRDAVGHLADVVVDVTAKAPEALTQAVSLVREGGTVVVAGTRGGPASLNPDELVYKEARLVGAYGVDTDAYRAALEMLASDRWPFAELPRRVVDLDGAEDLLRSMAGEGEPPPVHAVIAP